MAILPEHRHSAQSELNTSEKIVRPQAVRLEAKSFRRADRIAASALLAVCCWALSAEVALAGRLEVSDSAPVWAHFGADVLLYAHIGGGALGLLTGTLAIASRKGSPVHRAAGRVFFPAMFVTYAIGAGVAPFLEEGQRPNFVAGILALYLLITAWRAVRLPQVQAGRANQIGFVAALLIAGLGLLFMQMGAMSPSGTVDGSPPPAFVIFAIAGLAAAGGELNVLVRRTLSAGARIRRHLWRMCASLFFASGSFFLGQPQVFPDWFNATPLPAVFALAPLVVLVAWLTKSYVGDLSSGTREKSPSRA